MNNANGKKLVSVIITTYKGASCIKRAVDSVLYQTYENIEIIIVDDNGKDTQAQKETEQIIDQIKGECVNYYIHDINRNGAVARNTGIKYCNGEYISFLDDDDVLLPERIEKSVNFLEKHIEDAAVFLGVVFRRRKRITNISIPKVEGNVQLKLLQNSSLFSTGSNLFIRAATVTELGGFNPTYIRHQDLEFMLRLLEKNSVGVIEEYMIVKSWNGTNNIPKYQNLKKSKEVYHNDFIYVINRLSENARKNYYTHEAEALLKFSYGCESKEDLQDAMLFLQRYRSLTMNEHIYYYLSIIKIRNINLYITMKAIYLFVSDIIKNYKIRKKLGEKCCLMIDKMFGDLY